MEEKNKTSVELPGFRFHPTEEELIEFYLKNIVYGKKMQLDFIGFLNIYRYDPWDLPELSKIGEREWYFFVPRDRKHSNGGRPNRTTEHGFWKATGSDRKVVTLSDPKRVIGFRKTLVFYLGGAPRRSKTDWVMTEYRLLDNAPLPKDIVLCKIYRKATSLKELEERATKEEEKSTITSYPTSPLSSSNGSYPFLTEELVQQQPIHSEIMTHLKKEIEVEHKLEENKHNLGSNNIKLPLGKETLGQLQVPNSNINWAQDSILPQSFSPWLENLLNFSSPTLMAHITSFSST